MMRFQLLATFLACNALTSTCAAEPLRTPSHIHHVKSQVVSRGHPGCATNGYLFRPVKYTASSFEREWGEHLAKGDEDACKYIRSNSHMAKRWIAHVEKFHNLTIDLVYNNLEGITPFSTSVSHRHEAELADMSADIFSKMVYNNVCPGEYSGIVKVIYLEPLVGHLRHPFALQTCLSSTEEVPRNLIDLSYILFNPWKAADFHLNYHGKKYLFDMGSSSFVTSLQYLTTRYRQAGMDFTSIWAWEASGQDPIKYWDSVPETYKSRVHFYNIPVTDDLAQAAHPLNMIRNICEPGDFIAVKLDIDNGPLETAIIDEIQADEHLRHCISELFYEQHYNHPDMPNGWASGTSASLATTFRTFQSLRDSGLIVHYWP